VAGVFVSFTIQIPNVTVSGAAVMCLMIVAAVILNASFRVFMAKMEKRKDEKPHNPN
jgi:hypothetical protein